MKKNILLLLSVLLLLLLFAEGIMRLLGRYETYVEKNNICPYVSPFHANYSSKYHVYKSGDTMYNTVPFSERFVTNNEGCRDTIFTLDKTKYRVLALGDSFTEGIGASNDSTYPRQLAALFLQDTIVAEVWNAGISGSDPVFEFRWYCDKLLDYKPDLIVLQINSSDIDDIKIRGGFERFDKGKPVSFKEGPWFEPLYSKSYLFRTIIHDVFHYDWQFNPPSRRAEETIKAFNHINSAIDSFQVLCKKNNTQLMVVVHPNFYEFSRNERYDFSSILQHCDVKGIVYADVWSYLIQNGVKAADAPNFYWEIDGHFNNSGYGQMSRCIYQTIKEARLY